MLKTKWKQRYKNTADTFRMRAGKSFNRYALNKKENNQQRAKDMPVFFREEASG